MSETVKKTKAPAKPRKAPAKKSASNVETMPTQQQRGVSDEEVARLAHRYWHERGQKHGHHEEDWYRAEQELRGKAS